MKAILYFDLDDLESGEKERFERIKRTDDICDALFDFDDYLSELKKHAELDGSKSDLLDEISSRYDEIMSDHNITISDLYF